MLEKTTVTMPLSELDELRGKIIELEDLKLSISKCVRLDVDKISTNEEEPKVHPVFNEYELKKIALDYSLVGKHDSKKLDWIFQVYSNEELIEMELKPLV